MGQERKGDAAARLTRYVDRVPRLQAVPPLTPYQMGISSVPLRGRRRGTAGPARHRSPTNLLARQPDPDRSGATPIISPVGDGPGPHLGKETEQIVGVLLLYRQNLLDHAPSRGVILTQPAGDLLV